MSGTSCKEVEALLLGREAGLSAADEQRVARHLLTCAECAQQARWLHGVADLLQQTPAQLDTTAYAALIDGALAQALVTPGSTRHTRGRWQPASATSAGTKSDPRSTAAHGNRWRPWLIGGAIGGGLLASAAATLLVFAPSLNSTRDGQAQATRRLAPIMVSATQPATAQVLTGALQQGDTILAAHSPVLADHELHTEQPAKLQLGHARVRVPAYSRLTWHPDTLTLELAEGSVTAQVDPGPKRRFAVDTPALRVVVIGTHFAVSAATNQVQVFEGSVRIESRAGEVLREKLTAGEVYPEAIRKAAATRTAPPTSNAPEQPGHTQPPATAGPRKNRGQPPASPTLILARTRAALSDGQLTRAEDLLKPLLQRTLPSTTHAEALSLWAECARLAGHSRTALQRYRQVVHHHPHLPAAENALFAAARLAYRERVSDAGTLLSSYLQRYPQGRFVSEARRLLETLSARPRPVPQPGR